MNTKKLEITIALNDIWTDEYGNLNAALLNHIQGEIIQTIWKQTREETTKLVQQKLVEIINNELRSKISAYIEAAIQTEIVSGTNPAITVEQYVRNQISNTRYWQQMGDQITRVAEAYAKDVKKQYDVMFATSIVMGLREQGMLDKEKLEQLFLEKK